MYTLDDFINYYKLPWYTYLNDCKENKEIKFISVIELPVENFVRENELVLSTATGYQDDISILHELVTGVCNSNASCLILSVPSDNLQLPMITRNIANDHNLPVLLIPWVVRFSDIIKTVLPKIINSDEFIYEYTQNSLFELYFENKNIDDAVDLINRNLDLDLVIHNNKDVKYIIDLSFNGQTFGYISINEEKLSSKDKIKLFILPMLLLWLNKESIIKTSKEEVINKFMIELMNSKDIVESQYMQGALINFDITLPYTCIVIELYSSISTNKNYDFYINIKIIKDYISSLINAEKIKFISTLNEGNLILLINNTDRKIIDILCSVFLKKIPSTNNGIELNPYIGVSSMCHGILNFKSLYEQALFSLRIAKNNNKNIMLYESSIIFNIFNVLCSDENIKDKLIEIIEPLIRSDKEKNTMFLKTLFVYLKNNNISESARILNIHRQSLLNRISKIELLTGLKISNHDDVFLLEVAIRTYGLM